MDMIFSASDNMYEEVELPRNLVEKPPENRLNLKSNCLLTIVRGPYGVVEKSIMYLSHG